MQEFLQVRFSRTREQRGRESGSQGGREGGRKRERGRVCVRETKTHAYIHASIAQMPEFMQQGRRAEREQEMALLLTRLAASSRNACNTGGQSNDMAEVQAVGHGS